MNIITQLIPVKWIPYLMSLYIYLDTTYQKVTTQIQRTVTAVYESFDEENYLFFEDSSIPVAYKRRIAHSFPLTLASWMYKYPSNILKGEPFNDSQTYCKPADLDVLSVSLKIDNKIYDISPWIESLKIQSPTKKLPSWSLLVRCWILHSGVIIDNPEITVEMINTDGEDKTLVINTNKR